MPNINQLLKERPTEQADCEKQLAAIREALNPIIAIQDKEWKTILEGLVGMLERLVKYIGEERNAEETPTLPKSIKERNISKAFKERDATLRQLAKYLK